MENETFVQDERHIKFAMVSKELLEDTEGVPKASTVMVYVALCTFANNNTGESYPTTARLAERARLSVRTVNYALKNLTYLGYISKENRYREDGGLRSSYYRILK